MSDDTKNEIQPDLNRPHWTPGTPREIFLSLAKRAGVDRDITAAQAAQETGLDPATPAASRAWWAATTAKQQKAALRQLRHDLTTLDIRAGQPWPGTPGSRTR